MPPKYPQTSYLASGFELAEQQPMPNITLGSPATDILLDFRIHPALTLLPETPLDEAQHMLASSHTSVLPVVDKSRHFCGVVTENCLSDQVAMRHIHAGKRRTDLQVRDLMTGRDLISAVTYDEVARSSVYRLITLLKAEGVPFLLVVDSHSRSIIGVVAASELAKLFNLHLELGHRPSFMDIFDAVMH
ncbi:MAG: CBS domain-containing protein [Porticoccaceae bacterium]